ncbi:MAG: dihydrofolate reductase family protein, partial [Ilumatobacteraceae bacterium]
MLKVTVSMSVDGFVAGPDVGVDQAMGRRGEELHEWMFASPRDPVDDEVAAEMFSPGTVGAVLMGRRTFDVGIGHWGDDGAFGMPCVVVTHRAHEPVAKGATTFTFVADGLRSAVERARSAAGDKDVGVMGAELVRQLLIDGLIDEIGITLVPIVLGAGAALFHDLPPGTVRLEQVGVRPSSSVTHLRYR